jgi:hypothetical protein
VEEIVMNPSERKVVLALAGGLFMLGSVSGFAQTQLASMSGTD